MIHETVGARPSKASVLSNPDADVDSLSVVRVRADQRGLGMTVHSGTAIGAEILERVYSMPVQCKVRWMMPCCEIMSMLPSISG
jgi:hypothetical protein